jgi:hypothetical protein
MDTPQKKGLGWKEGQRQGDFTNNFSNYTYMPQNIYMGHVSVKKIYTLQQDKCKWKKFGHVSANEWFPLTLDLHAVYTAIDTYTQNTGQNHYVKMKLF